MEIIRVACLNPPTENRSRWAREVLAQALAHDLSPVPVNVSKTETFTVSLKPDMCAAIKKIAAARGWHVSETAGALIAAVQHHAQAPSLQQADTDQLDDEDLSWIREEIRPLAKRINEAIGANKIAFAEAATGVGKGRLIALQAVRAAATGKRVVVTAPLAIAWQLTETLCQSPDLGQLGVTLLLGRANFVSPALLEAWAQENNQQALLEWIAEGGQARNPRVQLLQQRLGLTLNWLLEDALELCEELPASTVMLDAEDGGDDNLGEATYKALQLSGKTADILVCSHHLLASYVRMQIISGKQEASEESSEEKSPSNAGLLPDHIDLLLVDEAHKLEEAFAAIFSQAFHLKPFERLLERSTLPGRKALLGHTQALSDAISVYTQQSQGIGSRTGILDEFPLVGVRGRQLLDALSDVVIPKKRRAAALAINNARRTLKSLTSGYGSIRLDLSPVRHYPQLVVGSASLATPFERLWSQVSAGVLVSATLYTDGVNAGLTRWKLAVPKERAAFLPPVIPSWVIDPVLLHLPSKDDLLPDDSEAWTTSVAAQVSTIAANAIGGTLVLCTSFANLEAIAAKLQGELGERLIIQSARLGASACSAKFHAAFHEGLRPVWLGVGAAWTGIDLSDSSAPAEQDRMLSDLVITRLPLGVNRSLTHERRTSISGFSIVAQEAVWHMRQGIGRLVRRPGVPQRNLWMLDKRLVTPEPWLGAFRQALKRYRVAGKE